MNIQIITSSYPASPSDSTAAAGLFVRDFALELVRLGHRVIVQVPAQKKRYEADSNIVVVPMPWLGGDQALASLNLKNPLNWIIIFHFVITGFVGALRQVRRHKIERILCMWVMPSGIFGWLIKKWVEISYDAWALGSDVWKIKKVFLGSFFLRHVLNDADHIYADGLQLCRDVELISGRRCEFLPSSRKSLRPDADLQRLTREGVKNFLFVGRYHHNKGPDILLEAVEKIPEFFLKNMRFHMFGHGDLYPALCSKIEEYGLKDYVKLNGAIEAQSLANYFSLCDYVIIPSRLDSIPVILSDAAQAGVPVIASDVGDMGDLVRKHRSGIVFPSENSAILAKVLVKAAHVNRRRFIPGVESLAKQFDIHETCQKWLKDALRVK